MGMENKKFYYSLIEKYYEKSIDTEEEQNQYLTHISNLTQNKEIGFDEKMLICNMLVAGLKNKMLGLYPDIHIVNL